ncbi:MAG: hypothetical protein WHV26_03880 [Spirochaetota bacterium]
MEYESSTNLSLRMHTLYYVMLNPNISAPLTMFIVKHRIMKAMPSRFCYHRLL